MDKWLSAIAASLAVFMVACLFVPQVIAALRRRRALSLEKKAKVVIPAATETAAVIMRFRRAVLHSDLADYFRPD